MNTPPKTGSSAKVHAYRDRLRAEGLRPVQHWVPDTRGDAFAAAAHREARALAANPDEAEEQAFIDAISAPVTS